MTIDKLPSGSYRIRHMENGKRYTITVKHRPSQIEAMKLVMEKAGKRASKLTLKTACDAYIEAKRNILSPTTLKEYTATVRRLPEDFKNTNLAEITSLQLQKEVNDFSKGHSPKTVANYAHFLSAVLKAHDISLKSPQLPQKVKKTPYIPTTKDVSAVLAVVKDTEHEIPISLACYGLRRSEICALTVDDLKGNNLTINKALVKGLDNEWVIKTTKTTESTRTIVIDDALADLIRERGHIYKYHPENLYKALQRAQDKAGVPRFHLHKLRHFFASYLHSKGYTDKQIQEMGGWKTDSVMKEIYQHAMDMDEAKQKAAHDISSLYS